MCGVNSGFCNNFANLCMHKLVENPILLRPIVCCQVYFFVFHFLLVSELILFDDNVGIPSHLGHKDD
jgi:hypothetical protein